MNGYGSNVSTERRCASPMSSVSIDNELAAREVSIPQPVLLESTTSTNDVARELAAQGASSWTVVIAETQTAGRGRLGRTWDAPPGSALLFSVILRPPPSWTHQLGWIPLVAGLAVAEGIAGLGGDVRVKWPNDVVFVDDVGFSKVSGILAERCEGAVVVGVGTNVAMQTAEFPVQTATSLAVRGIEVTREQLLARLLASWQDRWRLLINADGDVERTGIRLAYEQRCLSIGARVRVDTGKDPIFGLATGIDSAGHLVLDGPEGIIRVTAGDVAHLQ